MADEFVDAILQGGAPEQDEFVAEILKPVDRSMTERMADIDRANALRAEGDAISSDPYGGGWTGPLVGGADFLYQTLGRLPMVGLNKLRDAVHGTEASAEDYDVGEGLLEGLERTKAFFTGDALPMRRTNKRTMYEKTASIGQMGDRLTKEVLVPGQESQVRPDGTRIMGPVTHRSLWTGVPALRPVGEALGWDPNAGNPTMLGAVAGLGEGAMLTGATEIGSAFLAPGTTAGAVMNRLRPPTMPTPRIGTMLPDLNPGAPYPRAPGTPPLPQVSNARQLAAQLKLQRAAAGQPHVGPAQRMPGPVLQPEEFAELVRKSRQLDPDGTKQMLNAAKAAKQQSEEAQDLAIDLASQYGASPETILKRLNQGEDPLRLKAALERGDRMKGSASARRAAEHQRALDMALAEERSGPAAEAFQNFREPLLAARATPPVPDPAVEAAAFRSLDETVRAMDAVSPPKTALEAGVDAGAGVRPVPTPVTGREQVELMGRAVVAGREGVEAAAKPDARSTVERLRDLLGPAAEANAKRGAARGLAEQVGELAVRRGAKELGVPRSGGKPMSAANRKIISDILGGSSVAGAIASPALSLAAEGMEAAGDKEGADSLRRLSLLAAAGIITSITAAGLSKRGTGLVKTEFGPTTTRFLNRKAIKEGGFIKVGEMYNGRAYTEDHPLVLQGYREVRLPDKWGSHGVGISSFAPAPGRQYVERGRTTDPPRATFAVDIRVKRPLISGPEGQRGVFTEARQFEKNTGRVPPLVDPPLSFEGNDPWAYRRMDESIAKTMRKQGFDSFIELDENGAIREIHILADELSPKAEFRPRQSVVDKDFHQGQNTQVALRDKAYEEGATGRIRRLATKIVKGGKTGDSWLINSALQRLEQESELLPKHLPPLKKLVEDAITSGKMSATAAPDISSNRGMFRGLWSDIVKRAHSNEEFGIAHKARMADMAPKLIAGEKALQAGAGAAIGVAASQEGEEGSATASLAGKAGAVGLGAAMALAGPRAALGIIRAGGRIAAPVQKAAAALDKASVGEIIAAAAKGTAAERAGAIQAGMGRAVGLAALPVTWTTKKSFAGLEKLVRKIPGTIGETKAGDWIADSFSSALKRGEPFIEAIRAQEAAKEIAGERLDKLAQVFNKHVPDFRSNKDSRDLLAQITKKWEGAADFDQVAYDRLKARHPEVIKAFDETLGFIDEMHDDLYKLGVFSEKTWKKHKGGYLTRVYEDDLEGLVGSFTPMRKDVRQLPAGGTIHRRSEVPGADLVNDPLRRVAVTLNRQAYLLGQADMFQNFTKMGRKGNWADELAEAPRIWLTKEEFDAMPEEAAFNTQAGVWLEKKDFTALNSRQYGAADGGYLRKDVWSTVLRERQTYEGVAAFVRKIFAIPNRAASMYRVAVFGRDILSNSIRSNAVGTSIFNPENWGHYDNALSILREADSAKPLTIGGVTKTAAQWRRELVNEQIINRSFLRRELHDALGSLAGADDLDEIAGKFERYYNRFNASRLTPRVTGTKVGRLATQAKVDIDNLFRAAHAIKFLETTAGASVKGARNNVLRYWASPAFVSDFTDATRRGIGGAVLGQPGISYAHESVRVLKNVIQDRPQGLLYTAGGLIAAKEAAHAMIGVTKDEAARMEKLYGPFAFAYGRDESGQLMTIDPFRLDFGAETAGALGLRGKMGESSRAVGTAGRAAGIATEFLPVGGVAARGLLDATRVAAWDADRSIIGNRPLVKPQESRGLAAARLAAMSTIPGPAVDQFLPVLDDLKNRGGVRRKTAASFLGARPDMPMGEAQQYLNRAPLRAKAEFQEKVGALKRALGQGDITSRQFTEALQDAVETLQQNLTSK